MPATMLSRVVDGLREELDKFSDDLDDWWWRNVFPNLEYTKKHFKRIDVFDGGHHAGITWIRIKEDGVE